MKMFDVMRAVFSDRRKEAVPVIINHRRGWNSLDNATRQVSEAVRNLTDTICEHRDALDREAQRHNGKDVM